MWRSAVTKNYLLRQGCGAHPAICLGHDVQRTPLIGAAHSTREKKFMKTLKCILFALGFGLLAAPAIHAKEPSLYDASQARKLTPKEQAHFGPQSGNFRYDARMIRAAKIGRASCRERVYHPV